ncbi:flagellar hook-length control protein FliK [Paracoccus sp. Ld10]|uniref:flagellar hook-length control protein FliK n=1 Tax=Paracoccus sp. Ld10 TaxID=649158 RepID=UPI00386A787C
MTEIQIISPVPTRPDALIDVAAPASPTGETGFDAWTMTAEGQIAAAIAVPVPAEDPLAAWLDRQMGFSGQFSAPPGTDPAIEALAAGLPTLPEPGIVDQIDIQRDAPLAHMPSADPQAVEMIPGVPMPDAPVPVPGDVTLVGAADQPDTPDALPLASQPDPRIAAVQVPQAAATPIATQSAAPAVQAAAAAVGSPAVLPSHLGRPVPKAESVPVMRTADVAPVVPPPASDAMVVDRSAAVVARDATATVRAEITLPAGLAETMSEMPFGTDPHTPAAARTAVSGPGWQAATQDPRPVMQQVTDALVSNRGDRTEIALSPEELGRIRLVMSGPDRGQITIWAERPETLDLVRRNADLLTQQLAEAGVTAGSLDFHRDDRGGGQAAHGGPTDDDDGPVLATSARVRMSPSVLSDRRLDIRL